MMLKLKLYAAAFGAFLLFLITFGASQRKAERNKRTADRLKAMQEKSKIEKDVSNADRDSVIDLNTRP